MRCSNHSFEKIQFRRGLYRAIAGAGVLFVTTLLSSASELANKSRYHLFNPTPREQMRELSTDRPDQTESPYTVDAGHVQVEMDFVNYTHDRESGVTLDSFTVAPINFKMGLLNNVDIQFVFDSYVRDRVNDRPTSTVTTADGIGDLQTRLKINLWGNDGGETAFGVMPFVKWPTAKDSLGNCNLEGGIIFPLAVNLGDRCGLGLMTEFDFLRDSSGGGYHTDFVNSVTLSYDVTDKIGAYVEFFSVISDEQESDWQGQFDLGITYGLTADVQFDAGINLGVTASAPDYQPFVGLTVRF